MNNKLKYLILIIGIVLLIQCVSAESYTSVYPAFSSDYVNATDYLAGYDPYEAFDPSNSLIGTASGTSWLTNIPNVGYQKITIRYNESFAPKRIYFENFHESGASTNIGVSGIMLYGTNTEALFYDINYSGFESWNLLMDTNLSAHTGDNIPDPAYTTVTSNTTPYQYFALRIINNHGSAERVGLRRVELQIFNLTSSFYTADTTIAVNTSATFYNTSTGTIAAMTWNFGDGNYAHNTSIVSHEYNSTGTFAVNLNITDGSGNYDDTTHLVVVGVPPILNWTSSTRFDRHPVNATFTGGNIGNVSSNTTYTWIFGDGLYGNTLSPYHVYNTTGTFNVNLSSVNDYGSNFSYEAGYIEAIFLNASFMAYPSVTGGNVSFYDNSTATGSVLNWNWTSTNGWSTTLQNPQTTFIDTNRYNVSLIIRNQSVYNISTISPAVYRVPNIINLTGSTGDVVKTVNGFIEDQKYFGMNLSVLSGDAYASFDTGVTRTGSETLNLTVGSAGTAKIDYGSEFELSIRPSKFYQFNTYSQCENATSDSVYFEVLEYDFDRGYIGVGATSNKLSGTLDWQPVNASFTSNPNTRFIKIRFLNTVVGNVSKAWWDVNGFAVSDLNADFTANNTSTLIHKNVQFTDASDGIPTGWTWGFGDGSNSTDQNPLYAYHTNGTYSVNLNISNGGGANSATTKAAYITVYDPVSCDFVANITLGQPPMPVQFTFLGANATAYNWTFGDGNTSTLASPTFTYNINGTYSVTCSAINPVSLANETKTDYITVEYLPVANFNASPLYAAPSSNIQFQDLSTSYSPLTSWVWEFGDGNFGITQNPIHVYNTTGDFNITLNVTSAVGYDNETKIGFIHIGLPPVVDFTGAPLSGYPSLGVTFADLSTNSPTSWLWTFGDGTTSTLQNPATTYTLSGYYDVSLSASNYFGSDSKTKTGYISVLIDADFTYTPLTGVSPLSVAFADASVGTPSSWLWVFGDGQSSNLQNPTHTYGMPGTYSVSLTASRGTMQNTETKTVIVSAPASLPGYTNIHTDNATSITSQSAILNGHFDTTPNGTPYVWFNYGTTTTVPFRSSNIPIESVGADGSFSTTISGYPLTAGRLYYFQAACDNGTAPEMNTFTTLKASAVIDRDFSQHWEDTQTCDPLDLLCMGDKVMNVYEEGFNDITGG